MQKFSFLLSAALFFLLQNALRLTLSHRVVFTGRTSGVVIRGRGVKKAGSAAWGLSDAALGMQFHILQSQGEIKSKKAIQQQPI